MLNIQGLCAPKGIAAAFICLVVSVLPAQLVLADTNPTEIVRQAIEYWRDKTSFADCQMIIHRLTWERTMGMRSWTEGTKKSLVRFYSPAKDAGNASLKIDEELWSYNPKINRTIKIPSSMMHQSWMGSDFSYNDLARSDQIVEDYSHRTLSQESVDGHLVYTIEAMPKPHAPVVWGKEILKIRDDHILLEHSFFDQEMKVVKIMSTKEIGPLGGKLFAKVIRMDNEEETGEWTEVRYQEATFGVALPPHTFTLASLSSPRDE